MKKLISLCSFALAFAAMPLLTSCGNDDDNDTTKPVISNLEPADHQKLQIGKAIHFGAEISDNESLKSYKIDIHNAFDGHSHSHTRAAEDGVAFTFTKTWTKDKEGDGGELLAGKRNAHLHHHEITIPTHINGKPVLAGHYHFVLYVVDEAGNETFASSEVELVNEEVEDNHDHDHDHDHNHSH